MKSGWGSIEWASIDQGRCGAEKAMTSLHCRDKEEAHLFMKWYLQGDLYLANLASLVHALSWITGNPTHPHLHPRVRNALGSTKYPQRCDVPVRMRVSRNVFPVPALPVKNTLPPS